MNIQPSAFLTSLIRQFRSHRSRSSSSSSSSLRGDLTSMATAPRFCVLGLSLVALLFAGAVRDVGAATPTPPDAMTYQGYLVDASGVPLGNVNPQNYPVAFRIYSGSTGGTAIWSEQQIVTVDKGSFSVMLGEGTTIGGEQRPALSSIFSGANASDRFISAWVTINGTSSEILPRLRLVPAPYAFLATSAASLVQPNGTPVVSYDGGQVNITGNVASSGTISGNGSGLTALNASQMISGTLADARLSASVALRTASNNFAANQTITTGGLGLRVTDGGAGNINLQTLGGGNSGYHSINFNGFHDGSEQRYNANKARWRMVVDQRSTLDNFYIETFPAGQFSPFAITTNGYVGIGQPSPSFPLSFPNSLGDKISLWGNAGNHYGFGIQGGTLQIHSDIPGSAIAFGTGSSGSMAEAMRIINGRLGIGTVNPSCPLEVRGFANIATSFAYYSRSGNTPFTGFASGTVDYSIIAERRIGASEFNSFSDARIKQVVGRSDTSADLKTIQNLKVTDYHSIDKVAMGNGLKKGFIAQEVQKLIPEAVTTGKNVIPDIFTLASSVAFNAEAKTLAVTLPKAHALRVGERVRLLSDSQAQEYTVVEVPTDNRFVVGEVSRALKEVFVYGREVPDFLSVNYDRIFTTGIGAIQELAHQVQSLQSRQAQVAELEQKAARVDALEQELAALKKDLADQHQANARWEARFSALEKALASSRTPAARESAPTGAAAQ